MYITIDPYYSNTFYNECKEALKNNNVQFQEFVNIKAPYNWYFKLDRTPLMINYDVSTNSENRWMVNVVKALRPTEEYLLLRRENDTGINGLLKFIENEPLRLARLSDFAAFFTVKNRDELQNITKEYPGKIWYFGKYYKNKYRVCLAIHPTIKAFIHRDQILVEKTPELSSPGYLESELNYKILKGDMLIKFTETPYFENGQYIRPKIKGDISTKFII